MVLGLNSWTTAVAVPLVGVDALVWGLLGGALSRSVLKAVLVGVLFILGSWSLSLILVGPWSPLAEWWKRLVAYLLDGLIVGVPVTVLWFVLLIPSMAFKTEYRKLVWSEGRTELPRSLSELVGNGVSFGATVFSAIRETGPEGVYYGAQTVVQRLDLLYAFGYVMELTPRDVPYLNGATYSALFWKPLPRVFFPNKPREEWGNEFGQRYGFLDPDDNTTSVNMPQMLEMYVNFGIIGVVVGMWLLSQLYRALNSVLNNRDAGEWGTVLAALILSSLINVESNFLLVFGGLLQLGVLLYIIGLLVGQRGASAIA